MTDSTARARVGIVTALPEEHAAVDVLVDRGGDELIERDHNHYRSGWLPSKDAARPHRVAFAMLAADGTRSAAALGADMLRSFPSVEVLLVCGIAGAVVRDGEGDTGRARGPRLGDIVVGSEGIVDFGHVRRVDGVSTVRRPVGGISAAMLRADREMQSAAVRGIEPWRDVLARAEVAQPYFRRPDVTTDPRHRVDVQSRVVPAVFRGLIGSGDVLMRDAAYRDELALRYGLLAVEMEAAGVAAAADARGKHWFAVRGISDYCENATKNDLWHAYAALTAAAYARGLLAACLPFDEPAPATPPTAEGGLTGLIGLSAVVDALARIPVMADDYQRRAVLELLPVSIRTQIPDSTRGRIHLVGLVQTLDRHPGGRDAFVAALAAVLGEQSADFQNLNDLLAEHWPAA